jgi:TRAP transporter TAXI family solute receptor
MTMVNQLGGKNVAVGPPASATEIASLVGLEQTGAKPASVVNLSLGEGAEEVGDGVRDASSSFAGLPVGAHLSVAQVKDIVFLGFTDEELDRITTFNPAYHKTVIPAGTYPGQNEDVPTFGVKCLLIVSASLSDELAYEFAKAITSNVPSLIRGHAALREMEDTSFIVNDIPAELHPGAAAYFREVGLLK